jgi:hypothetical protein
MRKLFPEAPVFVVGEKGFDDTDDAGQKLDLLGRKPLGQKLTDLVDRIDQPLVIALDGGWGSGKSHFLKLWTGAHKKELSGKAEVIYFDAFEHDFLDDPLVSLVSRLTVAGAEKTWDTKAMAAVKRAALPLVKIVARVGLAVGTAGASEVANALGDAAIGKLADVTDAGIDQFWKAETNRIAAMQGFRKALTDLTTPKTEGDPVCKIVFIVDELDRCRPDYALSMLEIIKHFFAVPNVHFVLGVNLGELENSVKARYGHEIDSHKYLQKFVSLTMTMPKGLGANPDVNASITYFTKGLDAIAGSADLCALCISTLTRPIIFQDVGLRDTQRLIAVIALLPRSLEKKLFGYKLLVVGALYLKVIHPLVYKRLRTGKAVFQDVAEALALEKPATEQDLEDFHRNWGLWAYAFGATREIEDSQLPAYYKEAIPSQFRSHCHGFRWVTAQQVMTDALDAFELPSP